VEELATDLKSQKEDVATNTSTKKPNNSSSSRGRGRGRDRGRGNSGTRLPFSTGLGMSSRGGGFFGRGGKKGNTGASGFADPMMLMMQMMSGMGVDGGLPLDLEDEDYENDMEMFQSFISSGGFAGMGMDQGDEDMEDGDADLGGEDDLDDAQPVFPSASGGRMFTSDGDDKDDENVEDEYEDVMDAEDLLLKLGFGTNPSSAKSTKKTSSSVMIEVVEDETPTKKASSSSSSSYVSSQVWFRVLFLSFRLSNIDCLELFCRWPLHPKNPMRRRARKTTMKSIEITGYVENF
jgi:hypothetical protein